MLIGVMQLLTRVSDGQPQGILEQVPFQNGRRNTITKSMDPSTLIIVLQDISLTHANCSFLARYVVGTFIVVEILDG